MSENTLEIKEIKLFEKRAFYATEFRIVDGILRYRKNVKLPEFRKESAYYFVYSQLAYEGLFGYYVAFKDESMYLKTFRCFQLHADSNRMQFLRLLRQNIAPVDAFTFLEL